MVALFQHSECHKGDNKYFHPFENLKMPFNFFHCHGKLFCNHGSNANLLNAVNWCFTKINFCENVSFNITFNI